MSKNEELIKRIKGWQSNPYVHPLTCGVDSRHEVLDAVEKDGEVILSCPTCGWVQNPLPMVVMSMAEMTDERRKALDDLSSQAQDLKMGY